MRDERILVLALALTLAACSEAEEMTGAPRTGPADVDSLEACVLESAVAGREQDCIGLWSDACAADGHDPDRCAHLESRLWVRVLLDATPEEADLPYPAMQHAIVACERAGGPPGTCERDGAASVAIPALLAAEAH
ncbi:MAG: hypothetical protein AAFV19_09150 [Pseudomonadota bacterium]